LICAKSHQPKEGRTMSLMEVVVLSCVQERCSVFGHMPRSECALIITAAGSTRSERLPFG
jgi:hypothetical protein